MLHASILRTLVLAGSQDAKSPRHLSAASGLVRIGPQLYVVADDENALGMFDLGDDASGSLYRIFEGELPASHSARKAAKPDLEALTALPVFAGYPFGALFAPGSGSRPSRERAALLALDPQGKVHGQALYIDLAAIYTPLRSKFASLNVEGAFVTGDSLCLLQRGNTADPVNACIAFNWSEFASWLRAESPAPSATSITQLDLGDIKGVPLCFTDGCALADGAWVFCAAAEDTSDSYADGLCHGSAIGLVSAAGVILALEPLAPVCKVEGIHASIAEGQLDLLMVTDADDRGAPALLLSATVRLG